MTRTVCCRCGVNLTLQERTYYGTTCNGCEGELFLAAEEHLYVEEKENTMTEDKLEKAQENRHLHGLIKDSLEEVERHGYSTTLGTTRPPQERGRMILNLNTTTPEVYHVIRKMVTEDYQRQLDRLDEEFKNL